MNDPAEQSSHSSLAAPTRADALLLDFLRDHDAACPLCGYNLKSLTRPVCPECGQELVLTVGAARLRLGWLFAAVAPGFFSGIAAVFVLIPLFGRLFLGDGKWTPPLIVLDLFGFSSGAFAIVLATKRHRFLAQRRATQRWWALGLWAIHIAALALFLLAGYFGYLR